jgi:hypothetical protein
MKRQLLLFIMLACATISFAQKINGGIKAGISQAGLRGDAMNNLQDLIGFADGMITTTDRTGFFAGGYTTLQIGNTISIEPGIYYTQRGYGIKGELGVKVLDFLGVNAKTRLNTQYVDLPLLVKANIGGLQVFAGPQVSYLAKAELRTTAGALGFNVYNDKTDVTDRMNRWDAGVTGGLGYQFANGLNLSISYDHGMMKADAGERFESYNKAFKLGVGFSF